MNQQPVSAYKAMVQWCLPVVVAISLAALPVAFAVRSVVDFNDHHYATPEGEMICGTGIVMVQVGAVVVAFVLGILGLAIGCGLNWIVGRIAQSNRFTVSYLRLTVTAATGWIAFVALGVSLLLFMKPPTRIVFYERGDPFIYSLDAENHERSRERVRQFLSRFGFEKAEGSVDYGNFPGMDVETFWLADSTGVIKEIELWTQSHQHNDIPVMSLQLHFCWKSEPSCKLGRREIGVSFWGVKQEIERSLEKFVEEQEFLVDGRSVAGIAGAAELIKDNASR